MGCSFCLLGPHTVEISHNCPSESSSCHCTESADYHKITGLLVIKLNSAWRCLFNIQQIGLAEWTCEDYNTGSSLTPISSWRSTQCNAISQINISPQYMFLSSSASFLLIWQSFPIKTSAAGPLTPVTNFSAVSYLHTETMNDMWIAYVNILIITPPLLRHTKTVCHKAVAML